ncbi:MAG: RNA polymerase sigma factor [Anaerolineales bacterium]|nr:RNA polymerase sigma factor [Anaerolineales bacterium]
MLTFKELYEAYAADVYRFSLWLAGSRFTAEDITSETFVRAWAYPNQLRTETLKAFLFTIARNLYLDRQRKRKREVDLQDFYPDPALQPETMAEYQLEILRLQQFLQTLPEIDRAAFVLRVQHELPYAEISRVLGISLANTKVKIHRVRKKILAAWIKKETE